MAVIEVIEVNAWSTLRYYQRIWDTLWRQTPGATFFQTYQWLALYGKHFGEGKALRVFLVVANGETIGIVPMVEQERQTKLGRFCALSYPLDHWGSYFGPIGSQPALTLICVMRYLAQQRGSWELLDLAWLDPERDHGRTANALKMSGLEANARPGKRVAEIDLTDGYAAYLSSRKASFRQNLKRLTRRAEKAGITFQRFRPQADLTADETGYYDQIVDLAERSWQGASKEGYTLSHARVAPFLREAHAAAAERGLVDIAMLRQEEKVIAYCYNYHHQGTIQGLRTGYDREFRHFGPGTVLYGLMLDDGAKRGDQRYDLGADHQQAKRHWVSDWKPTQTICHYRPVGAGRSLALKWSHRCKGALQKWLARV